MDHDLVKSITFGWYTVLAGMVETCTVKQNARYFGDTNEAFTITTKNDKLWRGKDLFTLFRV